MMIARVTWGASGLIGTQHSGSGGCSYDVDQHRSGPWADPLRGRSDQEPRPISLDLLTDASGLRSAHNV
jgi:hypothetical protein